jgi:hypothetical protein
MATKPLNGNGNRGRDLATGISPADYPLGSLESRGAARAWLAQRPPSFSEYDADAALIHLGTTCYLHARVKPDYSDLAQTAIWQRGEEISESLHPTIPIHLDHHQSRSSSGSILFEKVHHREPIAGDVLRFEEVVQHETAAHEWILREFAAAWKRRLPDLFYPLKLENGKLNYRDRREEWQEETSIQPQAAWQSVERDATGTDTGSMEQMPTIQSVVYLGIVNGKHQCKPAGPEA